jgi:hypothetical protein
MSTTRHELLHAFDLLLAPGASIAYRMISSWAEASA